MGSLNCYCCKKPEGKQEIETPESISLPANFLDTNVFNSNSNDMLTSQTVNSTVDKPYNAKRNFNDIYEEDEIDFREDNHNSIKVIPKKPISKQLVNMNVPTKPPLEVINESNVESVNDSFRFHIMNSKDNNKMSKLNSSNQMPLANQESKSKKQLPTIKQETKSYSNSKNSEQGASSSRKYDVTLVKKEQNREDINEQWTKLFITNIIPESKLLSDNEDEVIYNGFLDKVTLTAGKIPKYVTVNKFSIVTKRQMKFYKSKEAYLTSQRPTMILNTESILFVRRIMLNSEIKAKAFFYMKLKETNASTNSISIRESTEKENDIEKIINETTKRDSIFSKFPRNSPNKSKRNTKRISLLNDSNISDMVESARERVSQSIMEQYDLMSKEILIFSTSDEELANNWVCVLDYLLNAKEY